MDHRRRCVWRLAQNSNCNAGQITVTVSGCNTFTLASNAAGCSSGQINARAGYVRLLGCTRKPVAINSAGTTLTVTQITSGTYAGAYNVATGKRLTCSNLSATPYVFTLK